MTSLASKQLKEEGYTILHNYIDKDWIDSLKPTIDISFHHHRKIQISNGNDIATDGVALHALVDNRIYIDFLEYLLVDALLGPFLEHQYFHSKFILNSFSALNNLPSQPNFSSIVHRDLRFYTGEIPIMINVLVMIDDFTEANGPTLLLPKSHLSEKKPSNEDFYNHCVKAIGKAGSVLLFNSNVWHASSFNGSSEGRRAIPITFTKSLIKQLLDYPRAIGYHQMNVFSEYMQQILGYHSRVPANLNDWYQPADKRLYRKNQD